MLFLDHQRLVFSRLSHEGMPQCTLWHAQIKEAGLNSKCHGQAYRNICIEKRVPKSFKKNTQCFYLTFCAKLMASRLQYLFLDPQMVVSSGLSYGRGGHTVHPLTQFFLIGDRDTCSHGHPTTLRPFMNSFFHVRRPGVDNFVQGTTTVSAATADPIISETSSSSTTFVRGGMGYVCLSYC